MTDESERALIEASHRKSGLMTEVLGFLRETKKWWLAPILLCVLLLGVLVFLGGTGAGPFIYTLF
jgi:hypothetical protein